MLSMVVVIGNDKFSYRYFLVLLVHG